MDSDGTIENLTSNDDETWHHSQLMFCLCPHVDLFVPVSTVHSARLGTHILLLLFFFSSVIVSSVVSCVYACVSFVCFGTVVILKHCQNKSLLYSFTTCANIPL